MRVGIDAIKMEYSFNAVLLKLFGPHFENRGFNVSFSQFFSSRSVHVSPSSPDDDEML